MHNIIYEKLNWDSENFGFIVARADIYPQKIDITALEISGRHNNVKLIYIFSPKRVDEELCHSNLKLVDTKLIYSKSIEQKSCDSSNIEVYGDREPSAELIELAYESGKYSRFKCDSNFAPEIFKNMYHKWISDSVDGLLADEVLVYRTDGAIVGFVAYKTTLPDVCNITLIAVNPKYSNRGVGSELVAHLEAKMHNYGIKTITTATQQDNIEACAFYSKIGMEIIDKTYIYHLWL